MSASLSPSLVDVEVWRPFPAGRMRPARTARSAASRGSTPPGACTWAASSLSTLDKRPGKGYLYVTLRGRQAAAQGAVMCWCWRPTAGLKPGSGV